MVVVPLATATVLAFPLHTMGLVGLPFDPSAGG